MDFRMNFVISALLLNIFSTRPDATTANPVEGVATVQTSQAPQTQAPTQSTTRLTTVTEAMWVTPCSQQSANSILLSGFDVDNSIHVPTSAPPEKHLERIERSAGSVKSDILDLKKDYGMQRIQSQEKIEVYEKGYILLKGVPETESSGLDTVVKPAEIMQTIFKNVASAKIFIRQAMTGERMYEQSHYNDNYTTILNGLTTTLCHIHVYMREARVELNEEVEYYLRNLNILDIRESSTRHLMDYIILRDVDKILFNLCTQCSKLIEHFKLQYK